MSNRVTSRRYHHADVRDRLASEYVLGTQTQRVRRRLETLINADSSWWEHIEQWQNHLSGLDLETINQPKLKSLLKQTWRNIESRTTKVRQQKKNIYWWLPVGLTFTLIFSLLVNLVILSSFYQQNEAVGIQPVSYLAMMSSETQKNNFALVAYQGDQPGKSSIRMQRNLDMEKVHMGQVMVWMRNKDTNQLQLIDSLEKINQTRYLSPTEWKMLQASSELIVTVNNDPNSQILYRGKCIPLSHWASII